MIALARGWNMNNDQRDGREADWERYATALRGLGDKPSPEAAQAVKDLAGGLGLDAKAVQLHLAAITAAETYDRQAEDFAAAERECQELRKRYEAAYGRRAEAAIAQQYAQGIRFAFPGLFSIPSYVKMPPSAAVPPEIATLAEQLGLTRAT